MDTLYLKDLGDTECAVMNTILGVNLVADFFIDVSSDTSPLSIGPLLMEILHLGDTGCEC